MSYANIPQKPVRQKVNFPPGQPFQPTLHIKQIFSNYFPSFINYCCYQPACVTYLQLNATQIYLK